MRLVKAGIALIGQLLGENLFDLAKRTRLPQDALEEIVKTARTTSTIVGYANH